jgi:hypothetical protein
MILLTFYYNTQNLERQKEINECLINNTKNNLIKKIFLFNDKYYDLDFINDNNKKIIQVILEPVLLGRYSFKQLIFFSNIYLDNEVCILANSDIFFDNSLNYLLNYNFKNKFMVLTRYEFDTKNMHIGGKSSQDTWIYNSPYTGNLDELDFCFGIPGCDNSFTYLIYKNNYIIYNPSLTIKSWHIHKSNIRTYTNKNRIYGYYMYIEPSKLYDKNIKFTIVLSLYDKDKISFNSIDNFTIDIIN